MIHVRGGSSFFPITFFYQVPTLIPIGHQAAVVMDVSPSTVKSTNLTGPLLVEMGAVEETYTFLPHPISRLYPLFPPESEPSLVALVKGRGRMERTHHR